MMIGRKWGYINTSGRMVINPSFQSAGEFHDGLARILVWSKVYCLSGEFTSDNAPLYSFQFPEDNKGDYRLCFPKDGRFGYMDKTGKIAIEPQFYEAQDFSEGLAAVRLDQTRDARFGYIDRTGRVAIVPRFHAARPFSEALAAVETSAACSRSVRRHCVGLHR